MAFTAIDEEIRTEEILLFFALGWVVDIYNIVSRSLCLCVFCLCHHRGSVWVLGSPTPAEFLVEETRGEKKNQAFLPAAKIIPP